MLLFNATETEKEAKEKVFQNISCYCLTVPDFHNSMITFDFKTSHVIV